MAATAIPTATLHPYLHASLPPSPPACPVHACLPAWLPTCVPAYLSAECRRSAEARCALIESLSIWPFNWSAWCDLAGMLVGASTDGTGFLDLPLELRRDVQASKGDPMQQAEFDDSSYERFRQSLRLPPHWMCQLGYLEYLVGCCRFKEAAVAVRRVLPFFPKSPYILRTIAHCAYMLKRYDAALEIFKSMAANDEHDTTNADDHADILRTLNRKPELALLAMKCYSVDCRAPTTQCVIGIYFEAQNDLVKASQCYQTATALKPR
eukprot:GHVU01117699.1.p1 GENE.GHVU01117699.1~~GHVU01117699.1.p1  ORF type:complete len:266 (+),score=22.35 GHVU01117699.1:88-885(+)